MSKGVRNQIVFSLIATLGAMVMGTILGWTSPANTLLQNGVGFPISVDDLKSFGSIFGIGAVFGALPAGKLSATIGRRYSMVLFEIIIIVGWIFLTMANASWMLLAGRVLQGVGVGALCTVIPTYVAEISQPHIRGTLGTIFQVYVVIGILYSYIIGSVVEYHTFNLLCGIWTILHVVLTFFIPESPYFFMYKKKDKNANTSMKKLREENDADIASELTVIKTEIELQKANQDTFTKVMANKANRKSLLIGIGCMFFQQTSGINAIIFYMGYIFNEIGSSITTNTSVIAVGIVQLVMTFVAMMIVDKAGRRVLLIVSAIVMSISFFCLGLYLEMSRKSVHKDSILSWLPLILIALYISAFSLGFGPIPWVVMGEIFSNEVKPYGTSLATATNWILVFAVTYLTFVTTNSIGFLGLFWIYSLFCALGALFVWYTVPETKNKSLTEIQLKLAGNDNSPSSTNDV
ncbi:facilitated trehalose transporter Tret1-like [Metopolophium dirhodum]|uniref:facilitated trehalose transporter Tret1-like n=1 Tax=Metopolophium dirhodum TaxID=44670 RepID=UPI00298FE365|nr:facilitated trehalose transporter Tret1-like [Metopolophium dirhodum]XP_060859380.1 facilitated trehalose transporter Tret1-like [Metopolophium dirhodum]